ncbi:autophagy-related protein 27 [Pseudoneurospora amorphoporcata]|uniref:Autophagy-related protein 27 n=1 Tax=Pseudoneurospora amorphoporcata TaxID=241081 RepID=A0AAN6NLL6_9PEZI|nr:autophagy-related protein 27 [Pseudoneurospora amorphoporcata]
MRPPTTSLAGAAVLLLAGSLPSTITATTAASPAQVMHCKEIVVDGHKYNFGELGGPHTVVTNEYDPPAYYNYTYTLDICAPLKRKGDVKKEEQCGADARVCRLKHHYSPSDKKSTFETATTLAGGSSFHYEASKLDSSSDHKDGGVKLTLTGYKHQARQQKVVINFLCNKTLTGTEGEVEGEDQYEKPKLFATRDDDEKKEEEGDDGYPETQKKAEGDKAQALLWNGYKHVSEDVDLLELTWHTKFACLDDATGDKPKDGDDKDKDKGGNGQEDINKSWGFFTWLVVLLFLAIAAYLIFGSWLNYNRYGARGWDLLPHGDTIRDIPYLLKDWTRRVLNTVQSSGSRGGYSAV